jgi:hypothetical protein
MSRLDDIYNRGLKNLEDAYKERRGKKKGLADDNEPAPLEPEVVKYEKDPDDA